MSKSIKLESNQTLIQEGERSNSIFWIQNGQLVVTKKRGNEEIILGHLFSGELVGELSFLDNEARSATVKAITDSELIEIRRETFEAIFKNQPKWLESLVMTLAERLRKANSRIKV
jgi:CRP/FNR family cyclic AMP-dependent transcriptional regulator